MFFRRKYKERIETKTALELYKYIQDATKLNQVLEHIRRNYPNIRKRIK